MYASCAVTYEGRAKSTLQEGNYLIIHKTDGTLLINGGSLLKPLNFQPPGAILIVKGNTLISQRKDETITIDINTIYNYYELNMWSDFKIDITGTEKDMVDRFISNIKEYNIDISKGLYREYRTPVGPIDILAIGDIYTVIEVKRRTAGVVAYTQLKRYCDYLGQVGKPVQGCMVSPKISKSIIAGSFRWIKFDPMHS